MAPLSLHDRHRARGAVFADIAGWQVPRHYGSPAEEHRAVRHGVGMADLSHRGRFRVSGADRVKFLQGLLTNDLHALTPQHGLYAALLTGKGKMVADMTLLQEGEAILGDTEPGYAPRLLQGLERYKLMSKVSLDDLSGSLGSLLLSGPRARPLLEKTLGQSMPLEAMGTGEARWEDVSLRVVRTHRTGGEDYELWTEAPALGPLWDGLLQAGDQFGVRPIGADALESLRVEAGIPRFGADMDEETFPQEAGIESRAVSTTKGCYTGQETMARLQTRGHVNRHLAGLRLEGDSPPVPGTPLHAGGAPAGTITSSARSPTLGPIALAMLRAEHEAPGTPLTLGPPGTARAARVVALPFI
ncbi:MAG: aminomethyl transferase family protein [Euryarchaeota archaeon]|nr:aminomethyl transferase family protein [Euryarchaeota archaeon]